MKSTFDPNRETIGKVYRDLKMNSTPELIQVGDMSREFMKGLVKDINIGIEEGRRNLEGESFYILVHEKRDLQMPDAFLRKIIKLPFRPYPEDDTTVFFHDYRQNETYFCWCLPHWAERYNILQNANLFDSKLIEKLRAWENGELYPFGFIKDELGNWMANPKWKDEPLKKAA